MLMWLVVLAGACMAVQDTLNALKVQALSRNHGLAASIIDAFLWGATITGTTIAVFAFHGNNWAEKITLIVSVVVGTFIGNISGSRLGKKFIKDAENISQDDRITALENKIQEITSGGKEW